MSLEYYWNYIVTHDAVLVVWTIVYIIVGLSIASHYKDMGYPKWTRYAGLLLWPIILSVSLPHFVITVMIPDIWRDIAKIFRD